MMVELLRPLGAEQARRWLAALLLVPPAERGAMVDEIERLIAQQYARDTARTLTVAHAPEQREGAVEQVFTTYEVRDAKPKATPIRASRSSGGGARA